MMTTELREVISYAETTGWHLGYFDINSAVVSWFKNSDWQRKLSILKQYCSQKNIIYKIQPCDDYVVVVVEDKK